MNFKPLKVALLGLLAFCVLTLWVGAAVADFSNDLKLRDPAQTSCKIQSANHALGVGFQDLRTLESVQESLPEFQHFPFKHLERLVGEQAASPSAAETHYYALQFSKRLKFASTDIIYPKHYFW